MKRFFEKIKFKLFGFGAVAVIAWFGSLLSRLPKIFERVQCLTGWEAISVFIASAFLGLLLLATLVILALFVGLMLEELLNEENWL